jgi:hypothetical protein
VTVDLDFGLEAFFFFRALILFTSEFFTPSLFVFPDFFADLGLEAALLVDFFAGVHEADFFVAAFLAVLRGTPFFFAAALFFVLVALDFVAFAISFSKRFQFICPV